LQITSVYARNIIALLGVCRNCSKMKEGGVFMDHSVCMTFVGTQQVRVWEALIIMFKLHNKIFIFNNPVGIIILWY